MDADNRIETLEKEFKLLKGELKQALSSVRDYLMEAGLPDSEYSTILAAMMGGGQQKVEMKGEFTPPKKEEPIEEPPEEETNRLGEPPAEEEVSELPEEAENEPAEDFADEPAEQSMGEEPPEEYFEEQPAEELTQERPAEELAEVEEPEEEFAEEEQPEEELAEEEQPEDEMTEEEQEEEPVTGGPAAVGAQKEPGKYVGGVSESTPRVELLANLIRWVASAKAEIGKEQLLAFLEVYGISGHLTPEFKEVILHLAETTEPGTASSSTADIWSRLMLELHGVLTGGDGPLHPVKPVWADTTSLLEELQQEKETPPEKPEDKPLKLKLVVTGPDGAEKEIGFDLSGETGD